MALDSTKASNLCFSYEDMSSTSFSGNKKLVLRKSTLPIAHDKPLRYWISAPITTNRYAKNLEVGNKDSILDAYQRIYFNPTEGIASTNDKYKLNYWPMNATMVPESTFKNNYSVDGSGAQMCVSYKVNNTGSTISTWETPYFCSRHKGYCMDIIGGFNHLLRGVVVVPQVTSCIVQTKSGSTYNLGGFSKEAVAQSYTTSNSGINNFLDSTFVINGLVTHPDTWTPYHADLTYTRTGPITSVFNITNPNSTTISGDLDSVNSIKSTTTKYWFKPFKLWSNINWGGGSLLLQVLDYMRQGTSCNPANAYTGTPNSYFTYGEGDYYSAYGQDASHYTWYGDDGAKTYLMSYYASGFPLETGIYKMTVGKLFCSVNTILGSQTTATFSQSPLAHNNFYGTTPMSQFDYYINSMFNGIRYSYIYDFLHANKTGSYASGDGSTVMSTLQYYFGGLTNYTNGWSTPHPMTVITYSAFADISLIDSRLSGQISSNRIWWDGNNAGSSTLHATSFNTSSYIGKNGCFIDLMYIILFNDFCDDLSPITNRTTWPNFSSDMQIGQGSPNPDAKMITWGEYFNQSTTGSNYYEPDPGPYLKFNEATYNQ